MSDFDRIVSFSRSYILPLVSPEIFKNLSDTERMLLPNTLFLDLSLTQIFKFWQNFKEIQGPVMNNELTDESE